MNSNRFYCHCQYRNLWTITVATSVLLFVLLLPALADDLANHLEVARIDDGNQRLFIVVSRDDASKLDVMQAALKSAQTYILKNRPVWGDNWSISFFSESRFADYKDEPSVKEFIVDGSWEKSYLAEYNNKSQLLTRFPLNPANREEVRIKIK